MQPLLKTWLVVGSVFLIPGALFVGFLIHEAVHVIQADGEARAVCYGMGLSIDDSVEKGYLGMYTDFSPEFKFTNVKAYYDWRSYSEKFAYFFQDLFYVLIGVVIGVFPTAMYFTTSKRKSRS